MIYVYGFTRVCSEDGFNGKESETQLFQDREERDRIMYQGYDDTFDTLANDGDIEKR